jgi:hypothetical protein
MESRRQGICVHVFTLSHRSHRVKTQLQTEPDFLKIRASRKSKQFLLQKHPYLFPHQLALGFNRFHFTQSTFSSGVQLQGFFCVETVLFQTVCNCDAVVRKS